MFGIVEACCRFGIILTTGHPPKDLNVRALLQESFLGEQVHLLSAMLSEQERLREERIRFEASRDKDVLALRQHAIDMHTKLTDAQGKVLRLIIPLK